MIFSFLVEFPAVLNYSSGENALSQPLCVEYLDALGSAICYEFLQTRVVLDTKGIQVSPIKTLLQCHICLYSLKVNTLTEKGLLIIIGMTGQVLV